MSLLLAASACQKKKAKDQPKRDAAAKATKTTAKRDIDRCRAAADGYVGGKTLGPQMIAACAALFGNPSCRKALEAAAERPSVESGMAAINACRLAYCPEYTLAELCEGKAPPTVGDAKAKFPRLAAEILEKEHADLKMLDSVAYLMVRPLLPRARAVYLRVVAAGDAVTVKIGEDGWMKCKTTKTVTVGKSGDLQALDGPLLGPLAAVAKGVEPSLVEVLVDPDESPRALEVATAAARFFQRRGMSMVICRAKRSNCPDVVTCP